MRMTRKELGDVLATLHGSLFTERQEQRAHCANGRSNPFVTISRQTGAGGNTFAALLVERLNKTEFADPAWSAWDHELVDLVSLEHSIPLLRARALENVRPTWMDAAVGGLSQGKWRDEWTIYHRFAVTMHALARRGHVVIVGRGGCFVTRDFAGGVHLRLVAPLTTRVERMANELKCARDAVAIAVQQRDAARELFCRRHWPSHSLAPEEFALTLYTASTPMNILVDHVVELIRKTKSPPRLTDATVS